ncbi:hypothetical protein H4R21_000118 [Coemansia helicoidea]|uniref:Uncharacterized protein n=1 Tax=Coemansia helicoidea TaxID=1286919 RepID=A0ACC1LGH4_9FUNG|nr:hypothetical protein H4R21_000118 [Coemansia helicoidea]
MTYRAMESIDCCFTQFLEERIDVRQEPTTELADMAHKYIDACEAASREVGDLVGEINELSKEVAALAEAEDTMDMELAVARARARELESNIVTLRKERESTSSRLAVAKAVLENYRFAYPVP